MSDTLIPSSLDKQAFSREVWERFKRVTALMARRRGMVVIPDEIVRAAKVARQIALRHQRGDLRHSHREMMYEQEVAVWLVEQWAELHGNPTPAIAFGPHN